MQISKNDLRRFEKQIILKNIGINGQKKLKTARVLIIGVGGLGCPLIMYLASCGVGSIGIVDNDKVDVSNLNRQTLFNIQDVNKFKVSQAKKAIGIINSQIKVSVFKERLEPKNASKIIKKYDVICDGTDNFETRYLINDTCLKLKKNLVSAAISKFEGHLFNFDFKKRTPCYRCFMPDVPDYVKNCDEDGVIPTLAGIMGTLQANEVIKILLNERNKLSGKILIFDSLKVNFRKVKLTKNNKCICKKIF